MSDSPKAPQQVCVMVRMSKRLCWVSLSVIAVQRREREGDSDDERRRRGRAM